MISLPAPPPQGKSLFGTPTWRPDEPGKKNPTFICFCVLIMIIVVISVILAKRYNISTNKFKVSLTETLRAEYVSREALVNFILVYILLAQHNASEVAILILLTRTDGYKITYPIIIPYVSLVWAICTAAPWPVDALFFKFQGLISDFLLVFYFARLYFANRSHHSNSVSDRQALLNEEEYEGDHVSDSPLYKRISLLFWASFFHLVGNVLVTFSPSFEANLVFVSTYFLAFPLYGLFAYNLGPKDHIVRFHSTPLKEVFYFIPAFLLSGALCAYVAIKAMSE
ncbi:hypothetical protein BJ742DRAFT_836029 [Cladochytrium replicatum]|nr:hypothetical protein BJ742DRAFT_836029 [Cladochytrium replicatum]